VEHANTDYPRRKRFVYHRPRPRSKLHVVIKVDFYISRRKPLGSETTKCPSLAKEFFKWLEETL
jgi:hypothetical protein